MRWKSRVESYRRVWRLLSNTLILISSQTVGAARLVLLPGIILHEGPDFPASPALGRQVLCDVAEAPDSFCVEESIAGGVLRAQNQRPRMYIGTR